MNAELYERIEELYKADKEKLITTLSKAFGLSETCDQEHEVFMRALSVLIPKLVADGRIKRDNINKLLNSASNNINVPSILTPYAFKFLSMIPPGFVTDENLIVYASNSSFADLFPQINFTYSVLSEDLGYLYVDELWGKIIHKDNRQDIERLMKVLKRLRDGVDELNNSGKFQLKSKGTEDYEAIIDSFIDSLQEKVKSIKEANIEIDIRKTQESFIVGATLHPPRGTQLEISEEARNRLENKERYKFVDIVAAWQVRIECINNFLFARILGLQPVLRDVTERLEKTRNTEHFSLARLWSHALKSDQLLCEMALKSANSVYEGNHNEIENTYIWIRQTYNNFSSHIGFLHIVRNLDDSCEIAQKEAKDAIEYCPFLVTLGKALLSSCERIIVDQDLHHRVKNYKENYNKQFAEKLISKRQEWLAQILKIGEKQINYPETYGQIKELMQDMGIDFSSEVLQVVQLVKIPFRINNQDPQETIVSRSLKVLFDEYIYNAIKVVIRQESPKVKCVVSIEENVLSWSLWNSIVEKKPQLQPVTKEVESSGINNKGLYTSYQIFSNIFRLENRSEGKRDESLYFRDPNDFLIRLLFPMNYFIT